MSISSLLLLATCLILSTPIRQGAEQRSAKVTVTGIVIALGGNVQRDDDLYRQLLVVRTTNRGNDKLNDTYLLVGLNYNCAAGPFTTEMFRRKRKWAFRLIPRSEGDSTFEQIKDMPLISPGGEFRRVPWMKMVPGNDDKKISPRQKLLSYEMNEELKPAK